MAARATSNLCLASLARAMSLAMFSKRLSLKVLYALRSLCHCLRVCIVSTCDAARASSRRATLETWPFRARRCFIIWFLRWCTEDLQPTWPWVHCLSSPVSLVLNACHVVSLDLTVTRSFSRADLECWRPLFSTLRTLFCFLVSEVSAFWWTHLAASRACSRSSLVWASSCAWPSRWCSHDLRSLSRASIWDLASVNWFAIEVFSALIFTRLFVNSLILFEPASMEVLASPSSFSALTR
mmetsp:Transcript_18014/g.27906  ORF Transcript_18014/g.27906 Transcript_18014/m.27906 type:complete len:239 (+) Transcript_18014:437-1153(+)